MATDVSGCQNDSAELLQVAFLPETFPFKEARSEETRASHGALDPIGAFEHQNLMKHLSLKFGALQCAFNTL